MNTAVVGRAPTAAVCANSAPDRANSAPDRANSAEGSVVSSTAGFGATAVAGRMTVACADDARGEIHQYTNREVNVLMNRIRDVPETSTSDNEHDDLSDKMCSWRGLLVWLAVLWMMALTAALIVYPSPGIWIWCTGVFSNYGIIVMMLVVAVFRRPAEPVETCGAIGLTYTATIVFCVIGVIGFIFGLHRWQTESRTNTGIMQMPLGLTVWLVGSASLFALLVCVLSLPVSAIMQLYRARTDSLNQLKHHTNA